MTMPIHRKTRRAGIALAVLLAGAAHGASAPTASFLANEARLAHPDGSVMVVSHRGCWTYTAENSLPGIDRCVALGVDMVEIDVRRTRDGALVLMHDASVDRTTDGHGKVRDLTLAQVRSLHQRAHGGGSEPLTDQRVPTLDEALDRARDRILVNLDVKDDDIYDAVIARVREKHMERQILVKHTPDTDPARLHRWATQIPFSLVLPIKADGAGAAELMRQSTDLPLVAVELLLAPGTNLDGVADVARQRSIHVWVNTMTNDIQTHRPMNMAAGHNDTLARRDPAAAWGWLIDRGIDMIQTDEPALALDYLRKRGRHAD